MKTSTCTCDPKTIIPSRHFIAKGKVHIFIVLNMRDYMEAESQADFERLRGGVGFAHALKNIRPLENFIEDLDEQAVLERGHEFQIFRGHLKDDWLYPAFRLIKAEVPAPPEAESARDWEKYEYQIRFSRTGFLEVRLTKTIPPDGENIVTVLQSLMELASRGTPHKNHRSLQLKLAMYCAYWFIKSISNTISIQESGSPGTESLELRLKPLGSDPQKLPYRQRYMTLMFREMVCTNCGSRIQADTLRDNHGEVLAAILEGVLVEGADGELALPEMDQARIEIKNLASWRDDLCVFAPERALIYFPEKRIFLSGRSGADAVNYQHYWECIARGIEHTIAVRAALQIIEYYTTIDLDQVPRLTQKVVDGQVTGDDKQEISHMAQAVSNTFNMLPLLRDVLVPSSSYRASYAVNKFEQLNSVLHIRDIQEHVERNVDELVGFVQFFASMEFEEELNQNEATINRVGIAIAFVALTVAGPSFLADFHNFFVEIYKWPDWTEWAIFTVLGVLVLVVVSWLLFVKPRKTPPNTKGIFLK